MTPTPRFYLIPLAGLLLMIAACASMKALPNLPASHPVALSAGPVKCSECHSDQQTGTLKPFEAFNHTQAFIKNHRFYAASDDRICAACHKGSFCADCHTNKTEFTPDVKLSDRPDRMSPHRANFLTLHKIEGKVDPASCYRCHGRSNNELCVTCHR